MTSAFDDVQRIVLVGDNRWRVGQHIVLQPGARPALRKFLNDLLQKLPPTRAGEENPAQQISIGFSRRGLERACVPRHVLARFAEKSPSFVDGAAVRAASQLGCCGPEAPKEWDPRFGFTTLDAVLTVYAEKSTNDLAGQLEQIAGSAGLIPKRLEPMAWPANNHVHFGFRDGLSHVGIRGWTSDNLLRKSRPHSIHAAGEFVLGHPQNSGANPWLASGGRRLWPEKLRAFFSNGSFGVLQQIEQEVKQFEDYLKRAADSAAKLGAGDLNVDGIRAKLCGRTADGYPVGQPKIEPSSDFDYANDRKGINCPFAAHARRMNPRDGEVAQTRRRPLLRRGMPYGPFDNSDAQRGLMGLFFCTSIEDQFEHLIGQWAQRIPLGSGDRGGARDPLIGSHEPGDGLFEIPLADGRSLWLPEFPRFTCTRGVAYLFYPSLTSLRGIADNAIFADEDEAAQ